MWNSKVIWTEGMFLQPQHFQQQERYLQRQLESRAGSLRPYAWGFTELELDERALALGEIAIAHASGVMEDGTPFSLSEDDTPPRALAIPVNAKHVQVVLALPIRRREMEEVDDEDSPNVLARWGSAEYAVRDSNAGYSDNPVPMGVGRLRFRLALESEIGGGYAKLGVARVLERRPDNTLLLDENYVPPCMAYTASSRLENFVRELAGLLHQRGDVLSQQVLGLRGGVVAEIADFLLLQIINRYEPLIAHFGNVRSLHPEALYRVGLMLSGELATLARDDKRPGRLPAYRHSDLWGTFEPLIDALRHALAIAMERHAIDVPIVKHKHVHVAHVSDQSVMRDARLILAVNAQMPAELLKNRFPAQSKMGPVGTIKELVAGHGAGIRLQPLHVAPRQIPFHKGYVYFELDRDSQSELWRMLEIDPNVAIHVAGDFPGLEMECWAIRD